MMEEKQKLLYNILKAAPKCQVHLHLDGSLSFNFIKKSLSRMKVDDPSRAAKIFPGEWEPSSHQELRDFLIEMKKGAIKAGMVMKPCGNWEVFDFCNNFLQTAEDLSDATFDLATKLYEDHGVNYIEIRFAPVLHTQCGLSMDDVVKSVQTGFERAQKTRPNIFGGIILCALRSYPADEARKLIPLIESYRNVVGFDIAGDEKTYPLSLFNHVINECQSKQIKVTVHAGEWPDSLHNIELASKLLVDRIGHGVALKSASTKLFQDLRNSKIAIEINLTANCANPFKVASFEDHPFPTMLENRIKIAGLNCDNLLLSGNEMLGAPDPTTECVRALLDCRLNAEQLYNSIMGGYEAGFCDDKDIAKDVFMHYWKQTILPELRRIISE